MDDTLTEVLATAGRLVPMLEHSGALVGQAPHFASAATSDPLIAEVHRLHAPLVEGPCLEAMTTGLTVISDSLSVERRWPRWAAAALAGGVRATVAVPLVWDDRMLGALGLYWESPHLLDPDTLNLAESCRVTASALVGWALSAQDLRHAMHTREMIGQATGVLMQRYQVSSDAAFNILRRHSQNANTKLREVAQTFLETGELPQPPPPGVAPACRPQGHRATGTALRVESREVAGSGGGTTTAAYIGRAANVLAAAHRQE